MEVQACGWQRSSLQRRLIQLHHDAIWRSLSRTDADAPDIRRLGGLYSNLGATVCAGAVGGVVKIRGRRELPVIQLRTSFRDGG